MQYLPFVRRVFLCSLLCLNLMGGTLTSAGEPRSSAVRTAYLASLGLRHTPPGCQVDHWIPLHCGGADTVQNLGLLCGPLLHLKEKRERNCKLFLLWIKD